MMSEGATGELVVILEAAAERTRCGHGHTERTLPLPGRLAQQTPSDTNREKV